MGYCTQFTKSGRALVFFREFHLLFYHICIIFYRYRNVNGIVGEFQQVKVSDRLTLEKKLLTHLLTVVRFFF